MKEKILVSACLIGENCRYDGKSNLRKEVLALAKYYDLIPVCPEVNGGMKTPRPNSEIIGDKVINVRGKDETQFYYDGAYWATFMKERSPSCGCKVIHNGKFDGKVIPGKGIAVRQLEKMGVKVIDEDDAVELLKQLEENNNAK